MITLLVVDDNQQNLYMLQVLLSANGFEVELTSNGAEALEKARRRPPDMIISDILMPVMDGFSLCRACKEDERLKHIPFVFYTATYTDPKDEEFALSLGADRFIIKPVEPDRFLALLSETWKNHEAGKAVAAPQPVEEAEHYKEYNAVLIRKLEAKMLQLEEANRILERDITERRRVGKALKDSEARYRTVLEANPDPVVVYDMEGRMIYVNLAFTRVFGWTSEERLGQKMDLCVPEENWPETKMMMDKVLLGESFYGVESQRYSKEGGVIPVSISAAVYRDEDGRPVGSVMNLRDIRERKTLEAQLLQAQKMEAIGTLAGGVAHDFNNLLQIVRGFTQLLLHRKDPEAPEYRALQKILHASERGAELTRQLLTYSRKVESKRRPIDLNLEVQEVGRLLERSIPKSIEIELHLADELRTVFADPVQLEQMLMNLALNAKDAMANGGKIIIQTENVTLDEKYCGTHLEAKPGDYALMTFSDTGHGMDEETLKHAFEPFYSTKGVGKGTGLGLAMVYGIVKNHHGHITCESATGLGTTFRVYLPVTDQEVERVGPA